MELLRDRARHRTEIVSEPDSKLVVHLQCLGGVSLGNERAHEQPVAALTMGSTPDQIVARPNGGVELGRPELEARLSDALERSQLDVLELTPPLGDPRRLVPGEQFAAGDVQRDAAGAPGVRPCGACHGTLRAMDRLGRRLDVDPRLRKHEPDVAPALDSVGPENLAELRHERAHGVVDDRGRLLGPERLDECGSRDDPVTVQRQERERESSLAPRELSVHAAAIDPGVEPAAQLNPRAVSRQGFANDRARSRQANLVIVRLSSQGGTEMSLLINCECGRVVKAKTEDEIVAQVEQHVAEDHPELVGKLSREDIVAMSEEVDD